MAKNNKLNYISLFSSAGVGCHGFKLEGFECIATVELLEKRLKIQEYNNKCKFTTGYIAGDILLDSTKEKIYNEIDRWKTEVDVILATPPCQGMSVANHKKKNEMIRNSLVIESIKIVNKIKPKIFVFENVKTFLSTICTDIDGKKKKIKEAIQDDLSNNYNISYEVINFKNYGNNSSRTRTLVIGVRKDVKELTPLDLMPIQQSEKTLKEVIGDLPELKAMGEIDNKDIYHNFRPYSFHMLDWIKDIKEGQSAFDNQDKTKIPHRVVNGEVIYNQNKNGDKYTRCYWNKIGPCIHTRNDILASQSTIHPKDNRVFSIRELMRLMTIPQDFNWVEKPLDELNKLSDAEKRKFLSREEINIRQSIGEAVPTAIFQQIASNYKKYVEKGVLTDREVNSIIEKANLNSFPAIVSFIRTNKSYGYTNLTKVAELANSKRHQNAAYYTRQDIVYSIISNLPDPKSFKELKIIEPAVGVGNFVPLLVKRYREVPEVVIDLVDIDRESLELAKNLISMTQVPKNVKINFVHADFLTHKFSNKYDILVGNPPFKKITNDPKILTEYKKEVTNKDTNNIFSFFIEKSFKIAKNIALITPKSLISAPEFNKTRYLINRHSIQRIIDYGELAFREVKIETISFIVENKPGNNSEVKIESYPLKEVATKQQNYITDRKYPYWLLYRDYFFDSVSDNLNLGIFDAYRDRQITKKLTSEKGKIFVVKARNISESGIIKVKNYDSYLKDIDGIYVGKYLNKKNVVAVPNLTYYPRATFLPNNSVADGSVALLELKNSHRSITAEELLYFSSEEFYTFYRIARNYGTRSLNVDSNSVYFWGLPKKPVATTEQLSNSEKRKALLQRVPIICAETIG